MTSFNLNVDANYKEVADLLSDVGDKVLLRARVSATNKAMTQTRTQIRKELSRATGVPSKEMGKRFRLYKANFKRLNARMFIGTMPFSAYKLGIRQLKRGGVSVRGPGGRRKVGNAFVATMPSGRTGVFHRTSEDRLPIEELKIHIKAPTRRVANSNLAFLGKKFEDLFAREFNFRTGREIEKVRARGAR